MQIPSINAASTYDNILTLLARIDFVLDDADRVWLARQLLEQISRLNANETRLDHAQNVILMAIVKALTLIDTSYDNTPDDWGDFAKLWLFVGWPSALVVSST